MLYKNKNTGVVIDVTSKIGGDWVPVAPEPVAKKVPAKKSTGRKKADGKRTIRND